MNHWEVLKRAERAHFAEEQRLCNLYDCYPWEIENERKKSKHRKRAVIPYVQKHLKNGVKLDQATLELLYTKYNMTAQIKQGSCPQEEIVEVLVEDQSAEFLEEFLELLIKKNDCVKKVKGQRM